MQIMAAANTASPLDNKAFKKAEKAYRWNPTLGSEEHTLSPLVICTGFIVQLILLMYHSTDNLEVQHARC